MSKLRINWIGVLGLGCAGFAAGGCSSNDAAETSAESTAQATVLFKDPSNSGLRLDVYDLGGHAAVAVSGAIGTDPALAAGASGSLVDLYRAIHPEASQVPAELEALDARLAPALAEARAIVRPEAAVATLEKSKSNFDTKVCKSFKEGIYKYTPVECQWSPDIDRLLSFHRRLDIIAGDRTYGWNVTDMTATMNWYVPVKIAYSITIPAYTWTWMAQYSGGPYFAEIYLPGESTGELGLTHHSLSYIIP